MKFVLFCHSLVSDWNHGNAHFLRGIIAELQDRGHRVDVFEPQDAWSRQQLRAGHGEIAEQAFHQRFPTLHSTTYDLQSLDLDEVLEGADVVLVHEWNAPELVSAIGTHRAAGGRYRLLFHDTHHRSVTEPQQMAAFDLRHYDGVLAFGEAVRQRYLEQGWAQQVWTWHEAADTRVFQPLPGAKHEGDLVWIGNWGDEERRHELREFLIEPVAQLGLAARVHGVRYPDDAVDALAAAGIEYRGWLPNHRAPEVFARHRVTVHVPRGPYARALPGIPTIRVFEALACGIPLVSAPWSDSEGLFTPGTDFLTAANGAEMQRQLERVLRDPALGQQLARSGLRRILSRHTCGHRVDELLTILQQFSPPPRPAMPTIPGDPSVSEPLEIAFFGSSLVSSYWNGAATYYRGMIRALAVRGHRITFYEPDALERQQHRDMEDPEWAHVVVYDAAGTDGVEAALQAAHGADVVVKASGVGVFDALLEREVLQLKSERAAVVFWDVDAPATLQRVREDADDPFLDLIPRYDLVLTYGGGPKVVKDYRAFGARDCIPVYNALDPDTHHPVEHDSRFDAALGLLANRLPDREARIGRFFFDAARRAPESRFLLGGSGWNAVEGNIPDNVRLLGHVSTRDHNAFNSSVRMVLNVNRDSMAEAGWSPPTRVFEAAGAGACLITDEWEGIEAFLTPGAEVLVARDGDEVARLLHDTTPEDAHRIGLRARHRLLSEHTYAHRALQFERLMGARTLQAAVA